MSNAHLLLSLGQERPSAQLRTAAEQMAAKLAAGTYVSLPDDERFDLYTHAMFLDGIADLVCDLENACADNLPAGRSGGMTPIARAVANILARAVAKARAQ